MLIWLLFSAAVLVVILGYFLFRALAARGLEKRKREDDGKPKRDENDRLMLTDDGELIDFNPADTEAEDERRRR